MNREVRKLEDLEEVKEHGDLADVRRKESRRTKAIMGTMKKKRSFPSNIKEDHYKMRTVF